MVTWARPERAPNRGERFGKLSVRDTPTTTTLMPKERAGSPTYRKNKRRSSISRIGEDGELRNTRNHFGDQLHPLAAKRQIHSSADIATRPRQTGDKTCADRIAGVTMTIEVVPVASRAATVAASSS